MKNKQDIYREALRLHKISFSKRRRKYFWQKERLTDTSHLPSELFDDIYIDSVIYKIESCCAPEYLDKYSGKFFAYLKPKEALILLLKTNYDNIHYMTDFDVDLDNYRIASSTYDIQIL